MDNEPNASSRGFAKGAGPFCWGLRPENVSRPGRSVYLPCTMISIVIHIATGLPFTRISLPNRGPAHGATET
jgi:hypothetical protein